MINRYDDFKSFLDSFNTQKVSLETSLHEASYDDTNKVYVYNDTQDNLNVISLDAFAQKIYLYQKFTQEEAHKISANDNKKLPICSVDSFLIDNNGDWYFIEFKNQEIKNAKESVEQKAYQNFFWITELLFREKQILNPYTFAKERIYYILVVPFEKNERQSQIMKNLHSSCDFFRPIFMEKLRHYVYKDAFVYTSDLFETFFVKKFQY